MIDTHGSMEIEKRPIWFDTRLIMWQRGDGTLSIRTIALKLPQSQRGIRSYWRFGFRSQISCCPLTDCLAWHMDLFNFWVLISGFPPCCCCYFCGTLGRLKWDKVRSLQSKDLRDKMFRRKASTFFFYFTLHDITLWNHYLLHVMKV